MEKRVTDKGRLDTLARFPYMSTLAIEMILAKSDTH